ncbi:MAG: hypothetical protein ACI9CD_000215, partial [Candidatus Deianiraeaceae bacterium]
MIANILLNHIMQCHFVNKNAGVNYMEITFKPNIM